MCGALRLLTLTPVVALPCGSISISRTFLPRLATAAAMFTQDVVFPTPPFWLEKAMIFAMVSSVAPPLGRGFFSLSIIYQSGGKVNRRTRCFT